MAAVQITTKAPEEKDKDGKVIFEPREITISYDFGDSLSEIVERNGEELVMEDFIAHEKVNFQNRTRAMLRDGESEEAIEAFMANEWKPGYKAPRSATDPKKAVARAVEGMSNEDKLAYLQKLATELGIAV